ncbi:MAG: PAS domain S-box protein, partial [Rhodothermales bacterium]
MNKRMETKETHQKARSDRAESTSVEVEEHELSAGQQAFDRFFERMFENRASCVEAASDGAGIEEGQAYQELVTKAEDLVLVYRLTSEGTPGPVIKANTTACERLGYSREELSSMSVCDIVDPEGGDVSGSIATLLKGNNTVSEWTYLTKNGQRVPVEVDARLFRLGGHDAVLAVGRELSLPEASGEDVETSWHFLRSILNALPVHIAVLDEQGRIIAVNEAWRRFAGDDSASLSRPWIGQDYLSVTEAAAERNVEGSVEVAEGLRNLLERRQEAFTVEYPSFCLGEKRWFVMHANRFQSEGPVRVVVAQEDITERKRVEEALLESEKRFKGIFFHGGVGVAMGNVADGSILETNSALQHLLGYTERELRHKTYADIIHPDDYDPSYAFFRTLLSGEIESYRHERRYVGKDGRIVWALTTVSLIRDAGGTPCYSVDVIEDISERKRAEEALRKSERFLYSIVGNLPSMVFVKEAKDLRFVSLNRACEELIGYTEEELVGRNDYDFFPKEEADFFTGKDREVLAGGTMVDIPEEPIHTRHQGTRLLHTKKIPILDEEGNPEYLLGISEDITERKLAEQALQASEERYKQLVEYANDIIYKANLKGCFTYANPVALRLMGYSEEDIVGTHFLRLVREDYRQDALAIYRRQLEDRIASTYYEFPGITVTGKELWLGQKVQLVVHEEEVVGFQAVARDITERKRAEMLLSGQKRVLELIAQGAPLAQILEILAHTIEELSDDLLFASIWLLDEDGKHLRHGAAPSLPESYTQAVDGLAVGPRAGSCGTAAFRKETVIVSDVATDPLWTDYRALALPHGLRACWSTPIIATTGEVLGTFAVYYPEPTEPDPDHRQLVSMLKRPAAIAIERHRSEQQLKALNESLERRVAERTVELERANVALHQRNRELQDFAYVASHDLQEPLRKIRAFADLMSTDYEAIVGENGLYYLDRMQDAALRMSVLINDLLAISRVSTRGQAFSIIDLNLVLAGVLSDLEYRIREVDGEVVIGGLPSLEADPTQMRQLFQNLIGNAIKFHQAGTSPMVSVTGEVVHSDELSPGSSQPVCRIQVQDNGIGFDEKYLDRIFSPFQRLHGRSEYPGTGVGLAICRRIVERHQGTITASSTSGQGASFIVTLPVYHG